MTSGEQDETPLVSKAWEVGEQLVGMGPRSSADLAGMGRCQPNAQVRTVQRSA